MKQITIAGNLGRDAELRQAGSGQVCSFPVAVEHREGQNKSTLWFDCSLWGKRGEALAQYLTKGTRVCVAGDLGTREHNGKTYLQVRADQVTLMGGGQDRQQGGYQQPPAQSGYTSQQQPYPNDPEESEIPF